MRWCNYCYSQTFFWQVVIHTCEDISICCNSLHELFAIMCAKYQLLIVISMLQVKIIRFMRLYLLKIIPLNRLNFSINFRSLTKRAKKWHLIRINSYSFLFSFLLPYDYSYRDAKLKRKQLRISNQPKKCRKLDAVHE
jgi:hypothetical protein